MTQHTTSNETPASLLAPLARGLMRRQPEILSLSIHDSAGLALWSSGDFLLPEDYALIAEVVEESSVRNGHGVRGQGCGLWWESADTARARCALPVFEGGEFRGVALIAFSGLTTGDDERAMRVLELTPVLPVLARAMHQPASEPAAAPASRASAASPDTIIAALRFVGDAPDDGLVCDIEALAREQNLLGLIDAALRDDEFALHLQPIVSLRDDNSQLIVEVLIRLPTQEFGVLASHEFLDTAERNGRMPAIDRWVVRALLVWMQRNRDRWTDANAVFSVNLSGRSVVRPDFRGYLEQCLDKSGLPLSSIRFEVAELDAGIAPQEFAALARSLIDRGCEVSVDNAGTGTGRFDFLREVNADILKIDGSLVNGASNDLVSRALINGLVHMADTLGMRTVASQVDSTGKLRAVTQLGVDFAQGYRVQEPEHIDTFDFVDCGIQRPLDAGAHA
ncbi:MAG TPA: EAL domain-containing protein [Steroidobacteraceae bacterium]|jgi:EAL domain-containing protein (putative c-di-GMP-specific phosphodiesterase class I)|nr:EAL domain-containing protein [Steroidobacteraceae bacterium]